MYLQKSARQWWASMRTQGTEPKTWKECRLAIMRQFLTDQAKDDVLTAWRALKFEKGESIQKYVDKFWDLHLKATVFKRIDFSEQKQQYCAGLSEDMRAYVNAQKPTTISEVIHHSMVATKIFSSTNKMPYKRIRQMRRVRRLLTMSAPLKIVKGTHPRRRKEFSKVKTSSHPKSLRSTRRRIDVSSVGNKGTLIVHVPQRTPKRILLMLLMSLVLWR